VRFAQSRSGGCFTGREPAAGQADLSGVILEVCGALGQQQAQPYRAFEQCQQHRRRPRGAREHFDQCGRNRTVHIRAQPFARIASGSRRRESGANELDCGPGLNL